MKKRSRGVDEPERSEGAVHKVRHAILDQFWLPSAPSHIVTHFGTQLKYVTHLGTTTIFMYMHTCMCIYREVCLSSRGFSRRFVQVFLSRTFCSGWFLSAPLLSEYIRCNRKLNITFNFRFHMYEKNLKSVTSHALGPIPCHRLSHLLGPPPPRAWLTLWTAT